MIDANDDTAENEKLLTTTDIEEHNQLDTHTDTTTPNKNDSSLVNTTTSASCSTLSVKSVIMNNNNNSNRQDETLTRNTTIDETKQFSSNNTKDETTNSASTPVRDAKDEVQFRPSETGSVKRSSRFTPSSHTKSQQQLVREQQLAESKVSLNNKANESSNRLSAASSRSSIHQTYNFDLIADEIDDLVANKDKFSSRSNLTSSHNSSQMVHELERAESYNQISDIYMNEMLRKRDELANRRKLKNNTSISSNSINSNSLNKSIKSVNVAVSDIKFDPNPNGDSVSVNTVESEKSCY